MLDKIEVHESLAKKMKRFNTITNIVNIGLITSTVITGGVSIATFANGFDLPVIIALSETSYFFLLQKLLYKNTFCKARKARCN